MGAVLLASIRSSGDALLDRGSVVIAGFTEGFLDQLVAQWPPHEREKLVQDVTLRELLTHPSKRTTLRRECLTWEHIPRGAK